MRRGPLPEPGVSAPRPLEAKRDAPVGGQAVLEGVMMRGVSTWAVAVRKPVTAGGGAKAEGADAADTEGADAAAKPADADHPAPLGEIAVTSFPLVSWTRRRRVYRWPLIRGVVAMAESLAIGMRALSISAGAQLPDGEQELSGAAWTGAVVVALVFAIGVFFVLPVGITSLVKHQIGSSFTFWLIEGVIRTAIFLGYLLLLSRLRDLRRVFEYHGAEHKVISCYEAEDELTPERAKLYSRLHPRCGTSFLLIVMIVAIFVFAPIGLPAWYFLVLTRILGVPIIAGVSFEIIKWAGRNRARPWVRFIMWPGLQLQKLTTREPDLDELAVAIAALNAVLAVETPGAAAHDLVGVELVA
ncbi:MAG TPA: DUF1385 domain-containing protein [Solirubrobacteraceae bacterium]|nr:DUF1385 domain-containing protein [Solirubrobacteraceae bacterium]